MFRASSAHLQEDTVVQMQRMVLSLSMRVTERTLESSLKLCTYKPPETLTVSDSTIRCICTTVSSWRWVLEARNM